MSQSDRDRTMRDLESSRIIGILRCQDPADAVELVRAYFDAGLKVIELTTSIPNWESVLSEADRLEGRDGCIGLGTVTSSDVARKAIEAGAKFIVSPFLVPDVMSTCSTMDVPVIPGALTPTEIHRAFLSGADMVKVFPVSSVGGAQFIKALLAPMPNLKLIPTGGVKPETAVEFIRAGAVAVGMGTNLVPKDALESKDWHAVTTGVSDMLQNMRVALGEDTSR